MKKRTLTMVTVVILFLLGIRYTIQQSELKYDIVISLFLLWLFLRLYKPWHQDMWSYSTFVFMLVLHNLYLYPTEPFGIRFDHIMHFVGGFSVALIMDRLFSKEKWRFSRRAMMIIFMTLGFGAMHEVIEWLGYGILGEGEGFLFFGAGDEGEWRNAMLDLIFNFFGAVAVLATTWKRHT